MRHNLTSEGIVAETPSETIERLEEENGRYRTALLHYAEQGCGIAQGALTPALDAAERERILAQGTWTTRRGPGDDQVAEDD